MGTGASLKTGADTKEAKTSLEEILRNSVNGCVHLLKGGEGPLGGMVTGQAFPSLGHAQHVNTIFTVSYRSAPPPPPTQLACFLPCFHWEPGQTHLHFGWDFCLPMTSRVNSSLGLLRNQTQMKGEPRPSTPSSPACSSAGFQWLTEQCVRFTELGVGVGSKQRQSQLPGQFPYESSWGRFSPFWNSRQHPGPRLLISHPHIPTHPQSPPTPTSLARDSSSHQLLQPERAISNNNKNYTCFLRKLKGY